MLRTTENSNRFMPALSVARVYSAVENDERRRPTILEIRKDLPKTRKVAHLKPHFIKGTLI